jgi:hypothetical protein
VKGQKKDHAWEAFFLLRFVYVRFLGYMYAPVPPSLILHGDACQNDELSPEEFSP